MRWLGVVAAVLLAVTVAASGQVLAESGDEGPVTETTVPAQSTTTTVGAAPETDTSAPAPGEPTGSDAGATPLGSFSVTNGNDTGAGSYRQAIADASADGSADVITFTPGLTITLASDVEYTGTTSLTLNGNGSTIDGDDTAQILAAGSATSVTINDLTLTNGRSTSGGAVATPFDLTINDSTLSGNTAASSTLVTSGGAVQTDTVTIIGSTFSGNTVEGNTIAWGGAVGADDVTITESTFVSNAASVSSTSTGSNAAGGAVDAGGSVDITGSTFIGNSATAPNGGAGGSAVNASGEITVTNSTLTGNTSTAQFGGYGAVSGSGAVTLVNSTLVGNTGSPGANVQTEFGTLTTSGSVIAEPGRGTNCQVGSTTSNGYNWSDDDSCGLTGTGDTQNGTDPLLGPARDNGSPPTMFPLLGSPLVDAIPNGFCDATLTTDQRGVARPYPPGGACDIGAIEAVFPAHGFTDVTRFYEATVRWITSSVNTPAILTGYDNNTFRQKLNITRGQVARMYYRAAGAPDVSGLPPHGFTDVTAFFEDAVRWAKANGVFDGFNDNTFRQANPITRGNFTRSLYGLAGAPDTSSLPGHGFTDVTAFYEDAVTWAAANGLADGFNDDTFRQRNNIKRGNASRITYNLAQTPAAWDDPDTAPANMLFRPNTT